MTFFIQSDLPKRTIEMNHKRGILLHSVSSPTNRCLLCWFACQIRFMLETMLALKNNDMRKIPGYDPELLEKLRKLQRTLVRK